MVRLQAALGSDRPVNEPTEDLAWHTNHALILANPYPKLDSLPVGV